MAIQLENRQRIEAAVFLERWFQSYANLGDPRPTAASSAERCEWLGHRMDVWRGLQNLSRWLAGWIKKNASPLSPVTLIDLYGSADPIGADVSDGKLKRAWTTCQELLLIVGTPDEAALAAVEATQAVADAKGTARPVAKRGPRKIDVAISLKMQHPEWDAATVAQEVPCDRSLLSRSKRYQDAAGEVERALTRLPDKDRAEFDARSKTWHPTSEDAR